MQISNILYQIDDGQMALPEFQRGYVWNSDQVRGLFESLYRRHPVGGLLVWATESRTANHRGDGPLAAGVVKLLLDGQQRITSIYGVVRGRAPRFFDGNPKPFTGLRFHLEDEKFEFYQPLKMQDDPLWVDVTALLRNGHAGLGDFVGKLTVLPQYSAKIGDYVARLGRLLGILEINFHIDEINGADKTLDVVVDIFNRVNSGGTKLSKGDLALAKICADWPEARVVMKTKLAEWTQAGYHFNLDWLLRSVNTVLTGEAKFQHLHDRSAEEVQDGLKRATKHIDSSLNLINGRLGLDHDQVFFGRFGVPVMVRYLDQRSGPLSASEGDKLLFWFMQSGMWGRFSGSTESYIDQDLAALEGPDGGIDRLLEQLRLWHGGLRVEPGHFAGWSLGARFYPVLYWLTRKGRSKDLGNGYYELSSHLLGNLNRLEVHHIFPKAQLYKAGYARPEVNALANFCFLTKQANLEISDRLPQDYFVEAEKNAPGSLASQWIPDDPALWRINRYRDFLEVRKELLAAEANQRLEELLHGDSRWLQRTTSAMAPTPAIPVGGITSEAEEEALEALNTWVEAQGLPRGILAYDFADPTTGEQKAIFDLVWPTGIQEELSQPVAVLLNEPSEILSLASQAGFRCFTAVGDFKRYVEAEILAVGMVA
ncbi:GmrSD restriction endonuclease domain-containing protein [Methylolobus aquaticus]